MDHFENSPLDFYSNCISRGVVSDFQLREVFNRDTVELIATSIKKQYPLFDQQAFSSMVMRELDNLSFGDRSNLIVAALEKFLPSDFSSAVDILMRSLGPEIEGDELEGYDGFYIMPLGTFVRKFGINHFELSMTALYEMTKRFSSEGPIREFIRRYPKEVLDRLEVWLTDSNPHVRRLISEGTRPRLPLARPLQIFVDDPQPIISRLLEPLMHDPSQMVRRSVANNLNDISKDNPGIVIATLEKYQYSEDENIQWVIRHALRTLLKQGNLDALGILGYKSPPQVEVLNFGIDPRIKIGEKFRFSLRLKSLQHQSLMIDYIIGYVKKSGKISDKTFKWIDKSLKEGEVINRNKTQSFRQMSTRIHYPGRHNIRLMINGVVMTKALEFEVFD